MNRRPIIRHAPCGSRSFRPAWRMLLLLLSPAWLGVASAAEYFVSPDGRDDAPGTSLAQP
jgi:hypothetical protein